MEMEDLYEDEIPERILAPIRAAKSFYGHESFATYLKSLSEEGTLANLSKRKLNLRLSLARSNPLLQTSNTSHETGKETVTMNDFLEYLSQE